MFRSLTASTWTVEWYCCVIDISVISQFVPCHTKVNQEVKVQTGKLLHWETCCFLLVVPIYSPSIASVNADFKVYDCRDFGKSTQIWKIAIYLHSTTVWERLPSFKLWLNTQLQTQQSKAFFSFALVNSNMLHASYTSFGFAVNKCVSINRLLTAFHGLLREKTTMEFNYLQ